ncbi:hypothetical protein, partial [Nocardioides sp.]|uniref:hypothetical protein n=1 Tax=Nocardioides sp. TaxID=35761 RepID=UPI00271EC36F
MSAPVPPPYAPPAAPPPPPAAPAAAATAPPVEPGDRRWRYRRSLASRVTLLTTMAVGLTVAAMAAGVY